MECAKVNTKRKTRAKFIDIHGRIIIDGKVYWSIDMMQTLRTYYPNTPNLEIAKMLNVSDRLVCVKARELGLKKSEEYIRKARAKGGHNSRKGCLSRQS